MIGGDVHSMENISKSTDPLSLLSSDMDYSLLASDMHKFLNISTSNRLEGKPARPSCSSSPDMKKSKLRNGAYLEDIDSHKCPLCPTCFNAKDLLARHALRIHQKAVVSLLQDVSTEQHLKCQFCVHKVMHRHQKLLLLHLEKKHAVEFVAFLKQSWMPSSIGHLQEGMKGMSLSGLAVKSKVESGSQICHKNGVGKSKLCRHSQAPNHSFAKRKLNLDETCNLQPSKSFLMKENSGTPEEPLNTTLAGYAWKHAEGKHFACGQCKEAFSCNALLLDHVSGRHRGPLRLLKPLYTCGLCSASFYKNSFLVRHCYQHHTPK